MANKASIPHEPLNGPTDSLIEPGGSRDSTYTDSPSEPESIYPIAPWDICWDDKPRTALSLFLIGLGCAIGQHVFYSMKDGTLAEHQAWTIRIGTGLAYLLGFSMAALVGISRDQWVWRTLRTRFFPLKSIDALFGVTSNVTCFLDFNMVRHAKVSTALAALKWLFPLVTIFTPSTISVISSPFPSEFDCEVPTLSFSKASGSTDPGVHALNYVNTNHTQDNTGPNPRLRSRAMAATYAIQNSHALSQEYSAVDTFDPAAYAEQNLFINNHSVSIDTEIESKDCYASSEALRYLIMSAYSDEVIFPRPPDNREHIISEQCSSNCSYSYEFVGPTASCTEFETLPQILSDIYHNISDKNIILFAAGQGSDLNTTDLSSTYNVQTNDKLYSPDRLWAFYSSANDSLQPRDDRSLHAYTCEFGPARYSIKQEITDRFLQPEITVGPIDREKLSLDNTTTCVLLQSVLEILRGYLVITYDSRLYSTSKESGQTPLMNYTVTVPIASNRTHIRSTNLIDKTGLKVNNPLGKSIEKLVSKMVVSLIADDGLIIADKVKTKCHTERIQNTYVYKPFILVLVNSTAMFFSALVAVLGAVALVENGVASDASFSTFLRTTRNPTLDQELRGGCLGGSSFRKRFRNLRLKYGEISVKDEGIYGDGVRHVGMGIEGEVTTMKKGKDYY